MLELVDQFAAIVLREIKSEAPAADVVVGHLDRIIGARKGNLVPRQLGFGEKAHVQRLRIESAKRRLERSDTPIENLSWQVGYEDPAFFRRLFRRTTGLAPCAYRKRFRIPGFARP